MNVAARDLATGKNQSIVIKSSGGLSEEEIRKMAAEAEEMKEKDTVIKEIIAWKNKSDSLIFATEKHMDEFKDKLEKDLTKNLKSKIDHLRKTLKKSEDPKEIQEAFESLDKLSTKIGEAVYSQQQGQQQDTKQEEEKQKKGKKDKKE